MPWAHGVSQARPTTCNMLRANTLSRVRACFRRGRSYCERKIGSCWLASLGGGVASDIADSAHVAGPLGAVARSAKAAAGRVNALRA